MAYNPPYDYAYINQNVDLTVSTNLTGTNGIYKSGTAGVSFTGTTNGESGKVDIDAGYLAFKTTGSGTALGGTPTCTVASGAYFYIVPQTNGATVTVNGNFTGSGTFSAQGDVGGVTATSTLNGSVTGISAVASYGKAVLVTKNLPTSGIARMWSYNGESPSFTVNYTSATSIATSLEFYTANGVATTFTFKSNGAQPFVSSQGLNRAEASAAVLALSMGGAAGGTFSNNGTNGGSGVTNFTKADAGTWEFGGDNAPVLNGSITLSAGKLKATHANALGTAASAIVMSAGTTVEVAGGLASFGRAINANGTITSTAGSNTLNNAITLGGTTTISNTAAGTTLTLSSASAISGTATNLTLSGDGDISVSQAITTTTGTLTKSGTGAATLASAASSFSGNVTLSGGSLVATLLANSGSNSSLGSGGTIAISGTSTLKVTGGSAISSTNRALTLTSATATLDSSNALSYFPVVLLGSITPSGTSAITLAGSNTGYNQIAGTFGASDSLTKSGAGRWILTAANAFDASTTGTFSAGTIMAANNVGATGSKLLGSAVAVAANAKIQTGSDGTQKGCNTYGSLAFNGTLGNPARIRIGGSAVSPTVYLDGDLTLPTGSDKANWDLTADVFKTPGTYTLFVFAAGKGLSGTGTVTSNVNATYPTGRPGVLAYNEPVGGPKTITVTIS